VIRSDQEIAEAQESISAKMKAVTLRAR